MNTNSIFLIGKDHIICEDYALSGIVNNNGFAIVSDGCSASDGVDIGARILSISAHNIIQELYEDEGVFNKSFIENDTFGMVCLERAAKIKEHLCLSDWILDATLLATWIYKGKLQVFIQGDGFFVHKTDKNIYIDHINLTSGYPDYLSYFLNKQSFKNYKKIENNIKQITSLILDLEGNIIKESVSIGILPLEPYIKEDKEFNEGDIFAVISDGANSFSDASGESIPYHKIISEFIGFKSTEGEFVERRIKAFKRKCEKEGIHHYDDISMAAIII